MTTTTQGTPSLQNSQQITLTKTAPTPTSSPLGKKGPKIFVCACLCVVYCYMKVKTDGKSTPYFLFRKCSSRNVTLSLESHYFHVHLCIQLLDCSLPSLLAVLLSTRWWLCPERFPTRLGSWSSGKLVTTAASPYNTCTTENWRMWFNDVGTPTQTRDHLLKNYWEPLNRM